VSVESFENLIVNGSFEQFDALKAAAYGDWWGVRNLQGWQLEGTAKDGSNWFEIVKSGHGGVMTKFGSKWLDMDASAGNIAINQEVKGIESGKHYKLSITLASRGTGDGVDIFWGGVKLTNIVPSGIGMETVTFTVTGFEDSAMNTLRLAGTGIANGLGVSVDDVSLVRVPDPVVEDPAFVINAINNSTADVDHYSFGATSGREFYNDFGIGQDIIHIGADLATSWADLQKKAGIYQSEGSAVVEFHSGTETLVFTHTNAAKLGPASFVFDAAPPVTAKAVGTNLIRNGSFETMTGGATVSNSWGLGALSIDGWSVAGTATKGTNWFEMHTSGQRSVASSDGKYWLDMDASSGNITISQQVAGIEEGRYYTLSFFAGSSKTGNAVDVLWDGQKIGTVSPTSTAMQEYSFVIEGRAEASMNMLTLRGTGTADGHGVSIDNVRLLAHELVEKPADIFDFGLGSGRLYATDFDASIDRIAIRNDLFSNYDELRAHSTIYQDGKSAILEFDNGRESIAFTQFDATKISEEIFNFQKEAYTESRGRNVVLKGTDGDDTLITGAGNQTIYGGGGFDIMSGGTGSDKFMIDGKSGRGFITDFEGGKDYLVITADVSGSYEHFVKTGALYQEGSSTMIEFATGQIVTLYGVQSSAVTADWFAFV
jgi:Ca2+-binding RTX toxin-like protein